MPSPLRDRAGLFRAPRDASQRLRWWGLVWAAWTMLAAAQAAVATVVLSGGRRVFLYSMLLFGSAAWLWVATMPLLIELARRLPRPRLVAMPGRSAVMIGLHVAAMLVVAAIHTAWWRFAILAFTNQGVQGTFVQTFIGRFDTHLFAYVAIVGAVYAAEHWHRLIETERGSSRVEAQLVATRLHVLMMQLQPHFLFNTLHSISELVHRDGSIARRTLGHLRDLLRLSFDRATRPEVPLPDEMRFLASYMEIQRMRFGDRLSIEVDVAPDAARACVPSLVLQPLVENAIRHGTAPLGAHGHIRVTAARVGDRLELRVEDNGRGPGIPRREGQGLRNTRTRLSELYGENQELHLVGGASGGTTAIVRLPYRESAGDQPAASPRSASPGLDVRPSMHPARFPIRLALLILGGWTFFGVLWAAQIWGVAIVTGNPVPGFARLLRPNLVNAWSWALMTGVVVAAVLRWPARRERWPARLALHSALALGVSVLLAVSRWLAMGTPRPFLNLGLTGWLGWDVMTYCVIAAFTHSAHLVRQRREGDARLSWLDAELTTAKLDALKWHLRPQFLIETLDDIASVSATDADRADDMTTSLGTLLRLMLQQVGTGESTVARELELVRVYADIQRMRSGGGLTVMVTAAAEVAEAPLPGVLLLPIVEELIGASTEGARPAGSRLFAADACAVAGFLVLTIDCMGDRPGGAPLPDDQRARDPGSAGLPSLERARSRLAAVHGDRCRVVVEDGVTGAWRVRLEIPFRSISGSGAVRQLQLVGGGR